MKLNIKNFLFTKLAFLLHNAVYGKNAVMYKAIIFFILY